MNGEAAPQPAPARNWAAQFSEWFRVPDGFAFHRGHGWARPELTGVLTLGIDDFAQHLVGRLAAVHLPQPGRRAARRQRRAWSLEVDGKRARRARADSAARCVAVNTDVLEQPTLVNEDPYGRGWLVKIEAPRGLSALKDLMSAAAARRWMEQVSHNLTAAMSPELGHVYQDGGMPMHGIARNIDEAHWDEVARRFLLTSAEDEMRICALGAASAGQENGGHGGGTDWHAGSRGGARCCAAATAAGRRTCPACRARSR